MKKKVFSFLKTKSTHCLVAGWGIAAVCLIIYFIKAALQSDYSDFEVYHRAATRFINGKYREFFSQSDGYSPYRYTPFSLVLFAPLGFMPYAGARVLWFVFGVFFYFVSIVKLNRLFTKVSIWKSPLALFCFLFCLRFALDNLMIGQTMSAILFLWVLSLEYMFRKREIFGGFFLAVAGSTKLAPLLLLGNLLSSSRRRSFAKGLIGVVIFSVFSSALFFLSPSGLSGMFSSWADWWGILGRDSELMNSAHYGNQSLRGLFLRLNPNKGDGIWVFSSLVMVFFLLLYWMRIRPSTVRATVLSFGLGVVVYILAMPQSFKNAYLVLVIPLMGLVHGRCSRLTLATLGSGIFVWSLAGKDVVGTWLFSQLQHASIPVLLLVLFGVCTYRELKRELLVTGQY